MGLTTSHPRQRFPQPTANEDLEQVSRGTRSLDMDKPADPATPFAAVYQSFLDDLALEG